MRKSKLVKKGIAWIFAVVMMLALAVPMADSKAAETATENSYDVSEYRNKGTAYTHPTKEGYIFAGWYTDADYQTPLGTDVKEGNAYAKFVPNDVLGVKYQLPATVSDTATTTAIRLITSVDSIDYQYVGFKVEYTENGEAKTREFQTRNVYSILKGNIDGRVTMKYKSGIFSDESNYLMALIIKKMPMAIYNSGLTVTPRWVTLDGTTVEGTSRNLKEDQESGTTTTPLTAGLYTLDSVEKDAVYVSGGKYGKAFSTNHRTGAITSLNGCNFGTGDFAISGWFKAPAMSSLSTGSANYLFGICPPDTEGGFSIQIKQQDSAVKLRINTVDGANQQPEITNYTANEWMHLAVVRSGDTLQVYLNGIAMITDGYALTAGYDFGNPKLAFGAYAGWANNYHNAAIWYDDLRVYGQALTEDEITAIVNNTDNTIDETTGTVTYSPAPKAHVTYDNSSVANTGTDTTISATLYKLDDTKKFAKSSKFVATGGVGTSVVGKYSEAIKIHHRTGANVVLDDYDFGKNNFTISCWFRTPNKISDLGTGPNNYLFGIGTPNTANVFSIQLKKNNDASRAQLRINKLDGNQTTVTIANITTYAANTWMHLVAVRDGDVLKVYLDGVLATTYDFSATQYAGIDFGKARLALGSYPGMTGNYQDNTTAFDDLRVYNQALTLEDVGYVKAGTHDSVASPVALVTFDDGIVANTGTDSTIKVGLYKMSAINASAGSNDFVEYNTTTGRDETEFGAIQMKHTEGPYTVLNGFDFGTGNFTISTWFNVPTDSSDVSTGSGTYLFGIAQPDAADGFSVCLKSGSLRFRLKGSNKTPAVSYEKGTWNQVALSRIDNTMKLYFNDTLLGTYLIADDPDFGTQQLAFGAYYGSANNYHGNKMCFDDMEVIVEGKKAILDGTEDNNKPEVEITYTGGKITNTGSDSNVTVGAYEPNTTNDGFVGSEAAIYTTGMAGDSNGALSLRHSRNESWQDKGAYTVVKDYEFGTNDFTISAWFKVPSGETLSTTAGTYLFGNSDPAATENGTFSVSLAENSGIYNLRLNVNSSSPTKQEVSWNKGTWTNVVLCRQGNTLKLYFKAATDPANTNAVNKDPAITVTLAENQDFGTKDLAFGGYYGFIDRNSLNTYGYQGNVMHFDNIQVHREALAADDVSYGTQIGGHMLTWAEKGRDDLTTLFIGDSFFNSTYWSTFYDTYEGWDAIRAGIGGSTTYDWDIFADSHLAYMNPKNLVVHLGTNDIHVDKDDAETVIINLQALFKKIHALDNFKDVPIYYLGIPYKRDVSATHTETVDAVNVAMKTWCEQQGWITYVEYFSRDKFTDNEFYDHTHITADAYKYIVEALDNTDLDMKRLSKSAVEITYTGGKITNIGTDRKYTVGAYNRDATLNGTEFVETTNVTYTTGRAGDENGAIVTNHANGPHTVVNGYNFGTNNFTISTWFNIPEAGSLSTGNSSYIMGTSSISKLDESGTQVYTTDGFGITLRRNTGDTSYNFLMYVGGENGGFKQFSGFEYGKWHNLVVVREGTAFKLYVNGSLLETATLSDNFDFGTKALSLGGYYGEPWGYMSKNVYFDDVQIYGEALDTDSVSFANRAGQHMATWVAQGRDEKTTLFVGDSFFGSYYWSNFYETYAGKDAILSGIPATTTYDWDSYLGSYLAHTNPKNLVVHLGTNNIHGDKDDAETAIKNLQSFFTNVHRLKNYKNTKMYYFGIPYKHSTVYGDGKTYSNEFKTTVDTVNAAMKTWCDERDWITYMDDLTEGKMQDADFRANDFTHLSLDGYHLITDALGKTDIVIENK